MKDRLVEDSWYIHLQCYKGDIQLSKLFANVSYTRIENAQGNYCRVLLTKILIEYTALTAYILLCDACDGAS